jgi:hypothetical protein
MAACLAACGGQAAPSSSVPPSASPSPTAASDDRPSAGDCVETDQPIGALTTLTVFRAAPCSSPQARYRVLSVLPTGLGCPADTEFQVDRPGKRYCLAGMTAAESSPSASIATDVAVDDCVHLEGQVTITMFAKVPCSDASATHRVLATFDSIVPECPAGTDQRVTITQPLSAGGAMVVVCLAGAGS